MSARLLPIILFQHLSNSSSTVFFDIHSVHEHFNNASPIPSLSARHVLQEVLERSFPKHGNDKRWHIVSIIRDPVARALGGFFQGLDVWMPHLDLQKLKKTDYPEVLKAVINRMLSEHPGAKSGATFILDTVNWQKQFVASELEGFWGLDLSSIEILDNALRVAQRQNVQFYLLQAERLEEGLKSIGKLFNKQIVLQNKNTAIGRMGKSADFIYTARSILFYLKVF